MKPTQEQILSALNKLVRESKTELKSEKIELGMMDDVMKVYKTLVKVKDKMDDDLSKVKKSAIMGDSGIQNFNKLSGDIEKAAKELGIPASDLNLQKLYSEVKDMQKEFDKVIKL